MAKLNEQAQAIFERLGDVSFDSNHIPSVATPNAVTETMKEKAKVTDEQLDILASVISDGSAAVTAKLGDPMIRRIQDNEDLANLDFDLDTPIVQLGLSVSRPTKEDGKELTREQYRANIGARVTVRGLDSTNAVADELASMWEGL
ncbi:hypothetical protein pVa21_174 [Vibrio phage pVa-21]|nr:hypothetical protein pVa21_174 [Vibrio phage pVa-21]